MANHEERFTNKCRVTVLAPNIIENYVLDGNTIEVFDVTELKKVNLEITKGQPYGILVVFGAMTEVSQGARELIASKEFQQNTVAKALLVNNIGHRLLGNFYLSVNRPHIKTKLFTDRELALSWLKAEVDRKFHSEKEMII